MLKTKDLVYIAVFTALIAAGAFIRIPVPVVPFTLQFLFTDSAGLILGKKRGTASVACYVVLGLVGLPIFTSGGGIFYVLEPTFGYIIGFVIGAFVTGVIAGKKSSPSYWRLLAASFAGLAVVYAFGMVYYWLICKLYLKSAIGISALFLYCFALAVPGDIALCFVAAAGAKRLNSVLNKSGEVKSMIVEKIKNKICDGESITRAESEKLISADLSELSAAADGIRAKFCGNGFDLCSILNAKSGRCGEDCKFCAQSARY
ncbi:MAG: biotin transporter BioY, partial [Clostridiales bacterium]|nr:biotin transporter BioY [Clostridiales bacterium]